MFDLHIVPCQTPEDREKTIAFIHAQPEHAHYRGVPGSSLFRIEQDGRIIAAFELSSVLLLSTVFEVEGNAKTTFRAAEAVFHAVESAGLAPVVECSESSPLLPTLRRIARRVFSKSLFFVR